MVGFAADALNWVVRLDAMRVRREVNLLRARFPAASSPELAEQAFSDARLQVIAAGAGMGLAANPVLSVAGALADLSVTTRTQVFAAACAAELILPGFLDRDSARLELLVPVFGTSVLSQLGVEVGLRMAQSATRQVVRQLIDQGGLQLINAVVTRVFGRRVTQRALLTKTVPLVGCVIGGTWNAIEVRMIRNRTLRYLFDQAMDSIELVDVQVVQA